MAVGENHFAPELNEKEVIELLENAKPESIKKATNYLSSDISHFWPDKH